MRWDPTESEMIGKPLYVLMDIVPDLGEVVIGGFGAFSECFGLVANALIVNENNTLLND